MPDTSNTGEIQPPVGVPTRDWEATPASVRTLLLPLLSLIDRRSLNYLIPLAARCVQDEEYQQAVVLYRHALAVAECLNDQLKQAELMSNLGGVYLDLAEYEKARTYLQKAAVLAGEMRNKRIEKMTLTNLGNACLRLGRIEEAIEYSLRARVVVTGLGSLDVITGIIALTTLGSAYSLRGQFDKAIQYFYEAEAMAETEGDQEGAGLCWINLAKVYNSIGEYQEAIKCGRRAATCMKSLARKRGQWQALVTLGNALANWGDESDGTPEQQANWQEAVRCFDQAIDVADAMNDREGQLLALLNRATVSIRQGEPETAIDELNRALHIAQKIEGQRVEAYCYLNRADAQVMVGERKESEARGTGEPYFDRAESDYQQALSKLKAVVDDDGRRAVYGKLGGLHAQWLDNEQEADQSYRKAIDLWERTRGSLAEQAHRIGFLARGLDAYNGLILLCMERHRPAEALSTAELARSRTLLERLAYSKVRPPETVDPRLLDREDELATERQRLGYALRNASGKRRVELANEINDLTREWYELLDQMETLAPDYVALRRGKPLSFEEIRACLDLE